MKKLGASLFGLAFVFLTTSTLAAFNARDSWPVHAIRLRMGEIPPAHAVMVGSTEQHYIVPITGALESKLEPGDLLVFLRDPRPERLTLNNYAMQGLPHIAVIARDANGRLMQVHAPRQYTSTDLTKFPYEAFHVLRLRKDAPGALNERSLSLWPASAREELANGGRYEAWRKTVLEKVNRYVLAIHSSRYTYDTQRTTEMHQSPENFKRIASELEDGRLGSMALYCSELAWMPFHIAGFPSPNGVAFPSILSLMDRDVYSTVLSNPGMSRMDAVGVLMPIYLKDRELFINLGMDDGALNALAQGETINDIAYVVLKKIFSSLLEIPSTQPQAREAILHEISRFPNPRGAPVGPFDIMEATYRPGNPFVYVGTYIGKHGEATTPTITGIEESQTARPEKLEAHLRSIFQHVFPISELKVSPDGRYVATAAPDETLRIFDMNTEKTITLASGIEYKRVRFSADGTRLQAIRTGGRRDVYNVKTGKLVGGALGEKSLYHPSSSRFEVSVVGKRKLHISDRVSGKSREIDLYDEVTGWEVSREQHTLAVAASETVHVFDLKKLFQ